MVWNTIHFAGMGLQIAAALGGGVFARRWNWIQFTNEGLEVSKERFKRGTRIAGILLWVLGTGFLLELFYEMHLLQIG